MTPRVASLLPSATELVHALGAGCDLVGVSHECDFPPEVRGLPVLTRARVGGGSDAEIDARVRELGESGRDLYEVDAEALRRASPDLVIVQDLCEVCAVGPGTAQAALDEAGLAACLVVVRADSLAGVARDAVALGEALGRAQAGRAVARDFEERLGDVEGRTADLPRRRVAALEWLDPPYAAGHWLPRMIRLAGGDEVLGEDGARSRPVAWEDVEEAGPEALCIVPCGFDIERARASWVAARERLATAGSPLSRLPAFVLDANALVSRPGPRLARGIEVMAALLHPEAGLGAPRPDEGAPA